MGRENKRGRFFLRQRHYSRLLRAEGEGGGARPGPGGPRRAGQLLSSRGGGRAPPGRRGCCGASPRRGAPSGMGRAETEGGRLSGVREKARLPSQGPLSRPAPCRRPPPSPRHYGGCGSPQGASPAACSREEAGAARGSGAVAAPPRKGSEKRGCRSKSLRPPLPPPSSPAAPHRPAAPAPTAGTSAPPRAFSRPHRAGRALGSFRRRQRVPHPA